ncbi:MAG: CDP-diacylglycerol--glycerol-3-phosphate 3-phosphatidyltransferase [Clostridia bacterium]|nr:CDP-diacylglycerol--glycerol-3-phosphate 3-phosphatidyltransferase [Clostridia bacterium]
MNLPNKLTLSRIIMIPFIMLFYLVPMFPYCKVVALALFLLASFTDMLDGKIARKYNLITNFGKFLDPIADKLLTSTVLFMIVADGTVNMYFGVITLTIVIGREFMVAALRQLAATKGVVIAADKLGKYKTVSQMVALTGFLLYSLLMTEIGVCTFNTVLMWVCNVFLGVSVLLTIISGINYMSKNKEAFKD